MLKKISFSIPQQTDIIPQNSQAAQPTPTSIPKSILKIKEKPLSIKPIDTSNINMYEMLVLKTVPWLNNYKYTYIKVYKDLDNIFCNRNVSIFKDREYYYKAKPQFYELLADKECDILFDKTKNILLATKVDEDGSSIFYRFSLCYHLTGIRHF